MKDETAEARKARHDAMSRVYEDTLTALAAEIEKRGHTVTFGTVTAEWPEWQKGLRRLDSIDGAAVYFEAEEITNGSSYSYRYVATGKLAFKVRTYGDGSTRRYPPLKDGGYSIAKMADAVLDCVARVKANAAARVVEANAADVRARIRAEVCALLPDAESFARRVRLSSYGELALEGSLGGLTAPQIVEVLKLIESFGK